MRVIIPCGGKNSRAKSVVGDCPKALYPLGEKSALGYNLDWVLGTDFSEVYIVVNPSASVVFDRYLSEEYPHLNVALIEQPEPLGDGDAIRQSFEQALIPFKYSREPLLVILGDKIPYGKNADMFQGQLNVPDSRKPPYSRLGVEWSPHPPTVVSIANNKFINGIRERRGDDAVEEGHGFNGIAYVKRGDYLYDKLRILRGAKVTSYGEYRIGSALKEMFHFGESFHGLEMQTHNVGDPQGIKEAMDYYVRANSYPQSETTGR